MFQKIASFLSLIVLGILITSCGTYQKQAKVSTPKPSEQVAPVKKPMPPVQKEPQIKTHKIGLLLPLSGRYATLGNGLLNAAELALFEMGSPAVTLLPKDTANGAHQAALSALDEGAELILGPVFAQDVESIKALTRARKVNVIAFSTDQSVAAPGTYVLGLLPSQQVDHILSFAKEKGLVKIAALTPSDQYGKVIDNKLEKLEQSGKIQLLGITHYSRGDILQGNPGNDRIRDNIEQYRMKGVQALVIPEGGSNLHQIMNLMKDGEPITVLGSGQWDAPETLRFLPLINEAYFSSTKPEERNAFEMRFRQAFGYTPPRIATLAYDATAMAIVLSNEGYHEANLTSTHGFSGVEGLFRLTSQGFNERALSVISLTPNGFQTQKVAPIEF